MISDKGGDDGKVGPEMYHIGTTCLYNNNFHSKLIDILSEIFGHHQGIRGHGGDGRGQDHVPDRGRRGPPAHEAERRPRAATTRPTRATTARS
ncbi:MAG: hypothetical protein MZV70_22075 [Desulfobacterales bacterium]|nr:hypothetical protein [Desulfobacterales bacterium]